MMPRSVPSHLKEWRFNLNDDEIYRRNVEIVKWLNVPKNFKHSWQIKANKIACFLKNKQGYSELDIPQQRQIQNIWYKYRDHNYQLSSLRPKTDKKGNYTKRHDDHLEDIFFDHVETLYKKQSKKSVRALSREVTARYRVFCRENGLKPACCGRKVITSLLFEYGWSELHIQIVGNRAVRRALLAAVKTISVKYPLERVEVDATQLDIFLWDRLGERIFKPYIVIAIDAMTGVIVGMTITASPPNAAIVARVIKQILLPLSESFFDQNGIKIT